MGVYINGMEMPTSCDECRLMVFEDTNCAPELYCGCPIVFKAHPQGVGHRPDYCPLVPVPPHGRLIDADALLKPKNQHIDVLADEWYVTVRTIETVPTIIEAEEGEA